MEYEKLNNIFALFLSVENFLLHRLIEYKRKVEEKHIESMCVHVTHQLNRYRLLLSKKYIINWSSRIFIAQWWVFHHLWDDSHHTVAADICKREEIFNIFLFLFLKTIHQKKWVIFQNLLFFCGKIKFLIIHADAAAESEIGGNLLTLKKSIKCSHSGSSPPVDSTLCSFCALYVSLTLVCMYANIFFKHLLLHYW